MACRFHLCLSCFAVMGIAAGMRPTKVSVVCESGNKDEISSRCSRQNSIASPWPLHVLFVSHSEKWKTYRWHQIMCLFVLFLSILVPIVVSFTQRPNAICQHPRLNPVCWLQIYGLSHLSGPTQSAVLHLWILMAIQSVRPLIDHHLVNRAVSVM